MGSFRISRLQLFSGTCFQSIQSKGFISNVLINNSLAAFDQNYSIADYRSDAVTGTEALSSPYISDITIRAECLDKVRGFIFLGDSWGCMENWMCRGLTARRILESDFT